MDKLVTKESIIAEYLQTGLSFRELGVKYDIHFQLIHRWVKQYRNRMEQPSLPTHVKAKEHKVHQAPCPAILKSFR